MTDVIGVQIQYHSSFVLERRREHEGDWPALLSTIRGWIWEHVSGRMPTSMKWFETGGAWRSQSPSGTTVETVAAGADLAGHWHYWAARFEHPDKDFGARIWRTDIGIESLNPTLFSVSVTNCHFVRGGHMGETPPPPSPSAPKLVRILLESRFWQALAGSEPLSTSPVSVKLGDGEVLRRRLEAVDRECPLVLVSRLPDESLPIDVSRVQRLVAGAATLYVSAAHAVDDELDWCLPEGFRCFRGAVRVYQPGVEFSRSGNARRHRFFKPGSMSPERIQEVLIRGICQLPLSPRAARVRTLDDVAQKERELRLADLKATAVYGTKEWVDILMAENQNLSTQLKQIEERNFQLEVNLEESTEEVETTRRDAERLRFDFDQVVAGAKARGENVDMAVSDLEDLPESLIDVLDVIERAFPNRLFFTERARQSAREATYQNIGRAWSCLRAMASELYRLHFAEPAIPLREIVSKFKTATGFDIGIGESEVTKGNRRLAAMREVDYRGEAVDISTHVKIGVSPPHLLRVHYHPHARDRVLVIGHCGNHLDTSRTN